MPGGGVARRPLHFIIMGNCSGSMKGPKIQALNTALRAMLPHLLLQPEVVPGSGLDDDPILLCRCPPMLPSCRRPAPRTRGSP